MVRCVEIVIEFSPPREESAFNQVSTSAGDNRRFVWFKNCVFECLSRSYPRTVLYRGFENRSILKILLKKEKKKTCREYIFMQLRADILQSVFTVLFFKQGEKQGKTMYVDRRPKFSQFDPGF